MFYELYKRSAAGENGLELVEDEAPGLLGDEILPLRDVRAPRQNRAAPFGTMRFGKRYGVGTSSGRQTLQNTAFFRSFIFTLGNF